jgi:hypothetical protein
MTSKRELELRKRVSSKERIGMHPKEEIGMHPKEIFNVVCSSVPYSS